VEEEVAISEDGDRVEDGRLVPRLEGGAGLGLAGLRWSSSSSSSFLNSSSLTSSSFTPPFTLLPTLTILPLTPPFTLPPLSNAVPIPSLPCPSLPAASSASLTPWSLPRPPGTANHPNHSFHRALHQSLSGF
jgi:hypothetical protein